MEWTLAEAADTLMKAAIAAAALRKRPAKVTNSITILGAGQVPVLELSVQQSSAVTLQGSTYPLRITEASLSLPVQCKRSVCLALQVNGCVVRTAQASARMRDFAASHTATQANEEANG